MQLSEFIKQKPILLNNVVILSPHSDDACYSLSSLIQGICKIINNVTICTIFSKTNYILDPAVPPLTTLVTSIRKKEDKAFRKNLNNKVKIIWLDYDDAPLRGYKNNEICSVQNLTEFNFVQMESLKSKLITVFNDLISPAIICPLSFGYHIDHIIINKVVTELICSNTIDRNQVFYYEDLPYAEDFDTKDKLNLLDLLSKELTAKIIYSDINTGETSNSKSFIIGCYQSQKDLNDWALIIKRFIKLKNCERLYYCE